VSLRLSNIKLQAEKGKHAPGYKKEWEHDFTWLELVRNSESGQVVGLICSTFSIAPCIFPLYFFGLGKLLSSPNAYFREGSID